MTYTSKEEPPDKPLKSKSYYLDLRSPTVNINQLKKDIVVLGGQVEKFLSKQINYVITDYYNAQDNLVSRVNSFPSPEIISADKKVRIPSIKLPLSRGQTLLLKSIRRNVEGSSNVLTNARLWGIKVINQSEFLLQLDKLKADYKLNQRKLKIYNSLVRPLRGSFIKFEDVPRKFKVHYKQFLSFPALTITNGYLGSPFDEIQNISNCEINLNRLKQDSKHFNNKPLGKTRAHNYCECCKLYYANMEVHLKSQEHERFASNERNYENVQSLIASLETLEALIANIKPEKEEQEASRSRQIITNNEVNESQAGSESQNKGTPACAASGDSYPTPKLISNACIIAQSGTDGDVTQTKDCNSEKQVLEQEPRKINRDKFTLETKPDRLNPHLDSKSSMSDTILKTTPNDVKYEIAASTLPPKKRILTPKPRPSIAANEIILPLKNVAQETDRDLHKKQQKSDNVSNVISLPQPKLDLSGMNGVESNETESQEVDTVQKQNASASETQPFCANNNQNNGHESDFDWDFDVEVDARHSEGPGNVPTLDFCSSNNDDNIDNEGWEIFKESILENAVHNVVPELSDLDICLPESETDVKCEGDKISANSEDLQKTELKTGTAWCTFSASESSEILELKNIETICKKLEAESQSVDDVERKGGDDFHETDSEMEFVHESEQDVIVDNRKASVNDSNSFIPIIKKHLPERPHSCPVDATQRTPLEENRPSSCPAEEELTTSSAGSTPNGDLEIEIVRSGKLPVRFRSREPCRSSQELDKADLSPSYDGDKLIESFITDNDDSDQQKLMITLKCKNHYWSATESLSPWRVQNSGDLKLQFKRSDLDQTEVKNENNVEWRVRTSGDCKLTLYTMKRKGYSKKENINVFYPKCKKRKLNL